MELPVGISNFKELIEKKYQFVDKTLFVKEIMNNGAKVILITRPRRFGKTLNMSMLYSFLDQNQANKPNLFENLEISKDVEFCKEYQNKYPVILISFKDIKPPSYQKTVKKISSLIRRTYSQHRYLLDGDVLCEDEKDLFRAILNGKADEEMIEDSLQQLSGYLRRYFDIPPIVLIDEYDTPIQESYFRGYYDELISFMRSLLGQALKDNEDSNIVNITKAIVTGITRVAQESLFSGLNNFEVYTLLRQDYGQYFGFTEPEVVKLIDQTGHNVSLQTIKEWYNGYQVGKYTLYNPWSIIECLSHKGELKSYWLNTADNGPLKTLVSKASTVVKRRVEELLQGKSVEVPLMENLVFADLDKKEDILWSFLLYVGYLNVLSTKRYDSLLMAQIAIPNREVRGVYDEMVREWFTKAIDLESYNEFVGSLSSGNIERFKVLLSAYLIQSGSYFDFNVNTPEQVFHGFILGLVLGLRDSYIIRSNQEGGYGRFDVALIPNDKKKNGIVIEFKTANTTELLESRAIEALAQIKLKKYTAIFAQHGVSSVIAIGLAFCAKDLELVHENIVVPN